MEKLVRKIGLVAHDAMKKDLIEWVLWNSELLMGQSLNIGIVRLQSHGICKEEKIINFPVHNARAHLLVTAQRTGFENGKIPFDIGMLLFQCCQNKGSRSTRTIELMPHKQFRIPEYRLSCRRCNLEKGESS